MKKTVSVITDNDFLFQKIYLILKSHAVVSRNESDAELIIWDFDSRGMADRSDSLKIVGRSFGDLLVPFSDSDLLKLLNDRAKAPKLSVGEKCAYLRGRKIKLTEVEHSLLRILVEASGEFVSASELLARVWGADAERGVLNVYVHYLREKLESEGEKIIISSRNMGYKIDEKYLKEGEIC